MTFQAFCGKWLVLFGMIVARYFAIAGGAYWLFYRVLGKARGPSARSIREDIGMSIASGLIFALGAVGILAGYDSGITLIYSDFNRYGAWYPAISFLAVLVLQDTYFYFLHRLFHHPALFRWIHSGHHRSGDPTPWTSFAFDIPEALVQTLFFLGIVAIVPLHAVTLFAALFTMTVWAVYNHLGFEVFPPESGDRPSGQWLIGSAHHAIHHRRYTVHYGLYFTFWDRICGTEVKETGWLRSQESVVGCQEEE
ncbi:sterol desaturase family protein [Pannus brasiliensis CCIBt3594]|uniref:Sterol desaturase family protein n=1 Tax=Pannus brasiliensis CCIBt3594 TaxID=1427578 RepID=A0AAW9QZU3_9CHRO